jgi:beta-glucosidase
MEFYENAGVAEAKFGWAPVRVEEDVLGEICEMARAADAVILCVGFDRHSEKEGRDRSYRLPGLQESLLARVSEVNPNCVAVVVSGGGMRTATWIDGVPAVLQAWYPGQEGGTALARVLFGNVSPSGKLPITMEGRYQDVPAAEHYYGPEGKTFYREGIFTGYRGHDRSGKDPLFPFGHGLSYTTFSYEQLEVVPAAERTGVSRARGEGKRDLGDGDAPEPEAGGGMTADAGPAEEGDLPLVFVSFEVKNTGGMPGSEIAQVYVRDVEASVTRPSKELKGFHKVYLNPGDSRRITIPLRADALSFWDPVERGWRLESGRFEILVGASSADIRLRGHYVH